MRGRRKLLKRCVRFNIGSTRIMTDHVFTIDVPNRHGGIGDVDVVPRCILLGNHGELKVKGSVRVMFTDVTSVDVDQGAGMWLGFKRWHTITKYKKGSGYPYEAWRRDADKIRELLR